MIHEEKLEVQVREAKAEIIELRRELEKCRQENERLQADAVDSKVLAAATRANQVAALQERLEALNDAKLVEDEALCTIEDKVADAIATADTDYGAHNAWECVVQMINLSEGIASEKAFARQIVRKFA
jgi:multidrug resistance efflux pump